MQNIIQCLVSSGIILCSINSFLTYEYHFYHGKEQSNHLTSIWKHSTGRLQLHNPYMTPKSGSEACKAILPYL